ncbi:hypothetical protein CBS101457_001645 [Exobasidium rhododendri]|nr:hypothetical protein CBS101457_001645 [Exobasidium rhododendri]
MRIAVVGGGVSGISATWALNEHSKHEVHLFESGDYIGGHTHTVLFHKPGDEEKKVMVDTGFIVFNEVTYPNFLSFLRNLDIDIIASDMSFSVSRTAELERGAFEWAGGSPASLFCQWSNLFNASHWRMVWDIIRFNYQSLETLQLYQDDTRKAKREPSIGEWLQERGYGDNFKRNYLIPMASSIWSTPPSDTFSDFPARTLLQFMHNHHLLQILDRPQWLTLHGGSKSYVERVVSKLPKEQLHQGSEKGKVIDAIRNDSEKWSLRTEDGEVHEFDRVIFATHADTTVKMLRDEWDDEKSRSVKECLENFKFRKNTATLHSDERLMPVRRPAWSAWNFMAESLDGREQDKDDVTLTYWMNLLQSLPEEKYGPILVTLNAPPGFTLPEKIVGEYEYDHPSYTANSVASQKVLSGLQGWKGARFAGAWTNYGFHEDGFTSGLQASTQLGAVLPFDMQSAERSLPPSSSIGLFTLKVVEIVRNIIAPNLALLIAPIYIALFLLLETIINAGVYVSVGAGKRSAIRNEIRNVRASWERQLPGKWQATIAEATKTDKKKR